MKKLILMLFLATLLIAGKYNVDMAHSNVGFKVKHMMISSVNGSFKEYSGEIEYDEKNKIIKSLSGTIKASSINTENAKRDNHLRSADFFDVKKYPEIKFEMIRQKGDKVYGKLTMRGVTKDIKLDLEMGGTVKDPWGNMRLGFTLEGKINREDFGLTYNTILEAGGIAIGKEVKLIIEIEAIEEKDKK